jgi:23S rRNA pseudouridine1911/1915/1917 synthase
MSAPRAVQQPESLLAFLSAAHPEVKKTTLRQWLKFGSVVVNGQLVTRGNHGLQVGDVVVIRGKDQHRADRRLPAGLEVLFEDPVLLVVEKPPNLLSMGTPSQRERTVYAYLTDYVRRGNPRSEERVWIVHRLDRETSGVMVFARTEGAKRRLQSDWSASEKRYLAVVEGNPPADQGLLTSHLDETGPFKVYSAPPGPRTRPATTRYRVLKRSASLALLELTLDTGRRNQIRVQLADLGHPVAGDRKYQAATDPVGRLALHATSLRFQHPLNGQSLQFDSPLPAELARLV